MGVTSVTELNLRLNEAESASTVLGRAGVASSYNAERSRSRLSVT